MQEDSGMVSALNATGSKNDGTNSTGALVLLFVGLMALEVFAPLLDHRYEEDK
jgi:hypothetical protein